MNIEEIKIADLSEDPSNSRQHPAKNIDAIVASLRRYGQQKPIVIGSDNVIIAGNGTKAAAEKLGWESIKCVRSELKGAEAIAYAIADNRLSDLSEFDTAILGQHLEALAADGLDLNEIGFDEFDLKKLIPEFSPDLPADDDGTTIEGKFLVIVQCENEDQQQSLFDELRDRGLKVKV